MIFLSGIKISTNNSLHSMKSDWGFLSIMRRTSIENRFWWYQLNHKSLPRINKSQITSDDINWIENRFQGSANRYFWIAIHGLSDLHLQTRHFLFLLLLQSILPCRLIGRRRFWYLRPWLQLVRIPPVLLLLHAHHSLLHRNSPHKTMSPQTTICRNLQSMVRTCSSVFLRQCMKRGLRYARGTFVEGWFWTKLSK